MRINGEWDKGYIDTLTKWLGDDGRKFFEDIINKYGHLNVVLPGKRIIPQAPGIPHPVHMREGMTVRNKMRDMHTAMGHPHEDAHWYDNYWQSAVKMCLGIPTLCEHCDDSGKSYTLAGGRYETVPCPHCKGGGGD